MANAKCNTALPKRLTYSPTQRVFSSTRLAAEVGLLPNDELGVILTVAPTTGNPATVFLSAVDGLTISNRVRRALRLWVRAKVAGKVVPITKGKAVRRDNN